MRTHLTLTSYCNQNRSTAPQFSSILLNSAIALLLLFLALSLSLPRLTEGLVGWTSSRTPYFIHPYNFRIFSAWRFPVFFLSLKRIRRMKLPSSFISSFIHLNFQYLLFLRPRRVNIIHILLITSFIYKISVALGLKVPGLVHVTESDEKNPPKITSSFIHQHFRVFFLNSWDQEGWKSFRLC
jgi:hypothetical protein